MHDQQQTGSDLQTAFDLLASVVREMRDAGRRTYSASVKPALVRRTNGGFNERLLDPGFNSFREFLDAAAAQGVVTVRPAPIGPDVEVLTPGAISLPPRPKPEERGAAGRIRRDIWNAFVDWKLGTLRAYDRERGVAEIVPAEPAPLEPSRITAERRAMQADPARYVPITPISVDQQHQIMQSFVEALDPSATRQVLELALDGDRPLRAFRNALVADPAAEQAFVKFRLKAVKTIIEDWRNRNGLDFDMFATGRGGRTPVERSTADAEPQLERVRRLIHGAIDRMPLEELNGLRIPLEFMVEP
jgi:hypothetical protein